MLRRSLSLWLMAVLMGALAWSPGVQASERMAMGLIVKLKDAQPQPLARLQALAVPKEGEASLRRRLSSAAVRARVSYLVQRPTAFGALVTHNLKPTRLAQAQAEAARLRQQPEVEWVVVNELEQPMALSTNDPYYPQQAWMADLATGGSPNIPAAFDTLAAFSAGHALSSVVVAVLDTGILPHPDLSGRVYWNRSQATRSGEYDFIAMPGGYDFVSDLDVSRDNDGLDQDAFDPGDYVTHADTLNNDALKDCTEGSSEWHGTAITGQLAAIRGNGIGMVGMLAPLTQVPVMPVRVAGPCGAAVSDIIEGMFWAAGVSYQGSPAANPHIARVLSLSFGGDPGCACANKANLNGADGGSCLYQNAVDALTQKGALLVAAAGNGDGFIGKTQASRPASCPGVLAVTALHVDGAKATYANLTPTDATHHAIATMGGDRVNGDEGILTTYNQGATQALLYPQPYTDPANDYRNLGGTSFATPIAAGTVALMWAVNPNLSPADILRGLRTSGVRPHVNQGLGACSSLVTGRCDCTAATCGPGVLDVDRAVSWAQTPGSASGTYTVPTVVATFFVPERLQPASRGSSGGGGVADAWSLAGLAMLAAWAILRPPPNKTARS